MAALEATLARPVPPPATGWAALGTWFEAPTPHGPLQLYLGEPGGPAAHAAAAALALHRAAPLLALLDGWLGDEAPDWRWQPHTATAGTTGTTPRRGPTMLRLPWRDSCHQLIAPWRWLRALPAPPDALAGRLHWPAIEAVLAIGRLSLRSDELQQLEPGGVVLLPDSMQPAWTGRLRTAHEDADAGVAVRLDDLAQPRVLPGIAPALPPTGPDGRVCEVRLDLRGALPAPSLAGWRPDALHDAVHDALHDAVSPTLAATLWQQAAGREPARCLAHGRLLPWGDGWGLLVDALDHGLGHAIGHAIDHASGHAIGHEIGQGLGADLGEAPGRASDQRGDETAAQAHVSLA